MRALTSSLGLMVLAGACVGSINEQLPSDSASGPGSPSSPSNDWGGVKPPCKVSPESGRVAAHRLSRVEYNNTVRDLFPTIDVGHPANDFPDDIAGGDKLNSTGLTVSSLLFEKVEKASINIAGTVVERGGFVKCDPTKVDKRMCAEQTLKPFMKLAWRRPVTQAEIDGVLAYLPLVAAEKDEKDPFYQAIKLALQDVLMSPNFLFRFEFIDDPASAKPQALDSYEMASRLSYFVYSSMPDAPLFAAADAGKLTDANELEAQVRRMLADPKAQNLVDKVAGGWLTTSRVYVLNPNPMKFPKFDQELRDSLKTETSMFVKAFLTEDLDFRDMMDAEFTFLNKRLAELYKYPGSSGFTTDFKRVDLSGNLPQRGGILTQGGLLAGTSVPSNAPTAEVNETSVIVRGRFILEHLLCNQVMSAPPDLDINKVQSDAQKDIPANAPRKVREGVRLVKQPCAGCHALMDPMGYALEHFDITGAWRNVDNSKTSVDSTGELKMPDGSTQMFFGAKQLGTLIKTDPRVATCVTRAFFDVAVGRSLTEADSCRMERFQTVASVKGNRLQEMVLAMTKDDSFTHQQGEAP